MSINSILFQSTYGLREPAFLNLDKTSNYDSLASYLAGEETESSAVTDKVDIAFDKVSGKLLTELASITASAIGDYPELSDDYVIAIIDGDNGREVRVYSRNELLEQSEGTEEEKQALKEELAKNPLLFFDSADSLPASSTSEGAAALAAKASEFLKTNEKLLDLLDKYGFNPFAASEA
ncbi:MAG: hypothetical protein LBE31_05330 [Deltaproteobacteria bacterium]|jgi:hypothetical protein|nr:hypothetical protein [Deltaproteobacteria bacterium]